MTIRNITKKDIENFDRLRNVKWETICNSMSFIMFDDEDNLMCYMVLEKEGICPNVLFEDETKNYKILDVFVRNSNPFGSDILNFKRLFWIVLTCDNFLSMYWTEYNDNIDKILKTIRFANVGDKYLTFYKSKNYIP